ncbi:hypothetical protein [Methanobrevibacter sp.]
MDSFEQLIGRNVNEISLNESTNFFIKPLPYKIKNCGKRYPSSICHLADLDFFNIISFEELFKFDKILIIWYNWQDIITDLEIYYLSRDFDELYQDYLFIKNKIDEGLADEIRQGDTRYLGALRLDEKVPQPNSEKLANKRKFVLKKNYLQKILDEMGFTCKL